MLERTGPDHITCYMTCFQGIIEHLYNFLIYAHTAGAPSSPLDSNDQRDFRDFSFVPTAGQGSDDPLVSLLKDISLAE